MKKAKRLLAALTALTLAAAMTGAITASAQEGALLPAYSATVSPYVPAPAGDGSAIVAESDGDTYIDPYHFEAFSKEAFLCFLDRGMAFEDAQTAALAVELELRCTEKCSDEEINALWENYLENYEVKPIPKVSDKLRNAKEKGLTEVLGSVSFRPQDDIEQLFAKLNELTGIRYENVKTVKYNYPTVLTVEVYASPDQLINAADLGFVMCVDKLTKKLDKVNSAIMEEIELGSTLIDAEIALSSGFAIWERAEAYEAEMKAKYLAEGYSETEAKNKAAFDRRDIYLEIAKEKDAKYIAEICEALEIAENDFEYDPGISTIMGLKLTPEQIRRAAELDAVLEVAPNGTRYSMLPTLDTDAKSGDVNLDGKVTVADAAAIMQHLGNADKYPLSDAAKKAADCFNTGDGVTTADAAAIQKFVTGMISKLPANEG